MESSVWKLVGRHYDALRRERLEDEKHDRQPPRVLVLMGLPGSGKSSFAKRLLSKDWSIVNQDFLGSLEECVDITAEELCRNRSVVVDRVNFTVQQRKIWTALASYRGSDAVCLNFNIEVDECIYRAQKRYRHPTLPAEKAYSAITNFQGTKENVTAREGFSRIEEVNESWQTDGVIYNWRHEREFCRYNFRQKKCILADENECKRLFCPFYHDGFEFAMSFSEEQKFLILKRIKQIHQYLVYTAEEDFSELITSRDLSKNLNHHTFTESMNGLRICVETLYRSNLILFEQRRDIIRHLHWSHHSNFGRNRFIVHHDNVNKAVTAFERAISLIFKNFHSWMERYLRATTGRKEQEYQSETINSEPNKVFIQPLVTSHSENTSNLGKELYKPFIYRSTNPNDLSSISPWTSTLTTQARFAENSIQRNSIISLPAQKEAAEISSPSQLPNSYPLLSLTPLAQYQPSIPSQSISTVAETSSAGRKRSHIRWSVKEHQNFITEVKIHSWGKWAEIAKALGTKNRKQVQMHATNMARRLSQKETRGRRRKSPLDVLRHDTHNIESEVRNSDMYKKASKNL